MVWVICLSCLEFIKLFCSLILSFSSNGEKLWQTHFQPLLFRVDVFSSPRCGCCSCHGNQVASMAPSPGARLRTSWTVFSCASFCVAPGTSPGSPVSSRVWSAAASPRGATRSHEEPLQPRVSCVPVAVPRTSPALTFPLHVRSAVVAIFNSHSLRVPHLRRSWLFQ